MRRWPAAVFAAILALACLGWAQVAKPTSEDLRRQTFEAVWQKVQDVYYDRTFNGVDWNAVKVRYGPKVAAVKTDAEFIRLMNSMLGELKRSHFAVIPSSVYVGEEQGKGSTESGSAGMTVQLVEGEPTVTSVEPKGAAAKAGIRPGFIIEKVGTQIVAELRRKLAERHDRPTMAAFRLSMAIAGLASGESGTTVTVAALDAANRARTFTLKLQPTRGQRLKFGELPTMWGWVESKRLPGKVGYLRFNIFMMQLLQPIQDALKSLRDERAMIIDLRGNPGGFGGMSIPIAAQFLQKDTLLGTTKLRVGETRLLVFARPHPFKGPLAILTDETSASTSEVLAGGMQESGRAIVVGGTSLGAVLPSVLVRLPDGSRLQCAFADFRTPKGVLLEGRGVIPDVPVKVTRRDLLAGRDPVLDKAVSVVLGRARKAK